jgi:hypothetical protein
MNFFKKLAESFISNESKFHDAKSQFLVSSLNSLSNFNLIEFPSGGSGRPMSFPEESPLHPISNSTTINIPKLLELVVLYMQTRNEGANVKALMNKNLCRIYEEIIGIEIDFKLNELEFIQMFEDCYLFMSVMNRNNDFLVSIDSLYVKELSYDEPGKYDNYFRFFNVFIGYSLFSGSHILSFISDEVEKLLKENQSKKFKSFDDFANFSLVNEIYQKNKQLGLINNGKLESLQESILNITCNQDSFTIYNYLEWLKLVLLYEGQTIEAANEKIEKLCLSISSFNSDWEKGSKIAMIFSDFSNFKPEERMSIIVEVIKVIYSITYYRN